MMCKAGTSPPTSVQTERAFQKQLGVTGCFKSKEKKAPGKSGHRFFKNVGLGFKTPREAIEGIYIDKKCPFTGNVSIRGRILTGQWRQLLWVLSSAVPALWQHAWQPV
jgi:hypothetical protein